MTQIWLNLEELQQLTGRKSKRLICVWLKTNGFDFITNAVGFPLIARSQIERRLGGPIPQVPPTGQLPQKQLNFAGLREATQG